MPTGISSSMLSELGGLGRVFPVFELTLGSTTHLFASEPISSESEGRYEPFVQTWGVIERDASKLDYSLKIPRMTVDIYDQDRVLQKAIGGPSNGAVIGSAADIVLRSYYVTAANHYTLVDGVVADYRLSSDRVWQFVIGPDDQSLGKKNQIPTISSADWFRAPTSSVGLDGQAVYGEHQSAGTDSSGAISCFQVHTYYNYWYVSIGTIADVTNVWRNGTLATGDFSLTTVSYNGITYSVLQDDTDTSTEDDEVTADVDGIEDANGDVETDPVNIIDGFMSTYSDVSLSSSIMAETQTFLSNRGRRCSMVVRSSETPLSVFNKWCNAFKAVPFWASDWTLAASPFKSAPSTIYLDSRHIHQAGKKILSPIRCDTDRSDVVSRIVGSHTFMDSTSSYGKSNVVEDPDRDLIVGTDQIAFDEAKV